MKTQTKKPTQKEQVSAQVIVSALQKETLPITKKLGLLSVESTEDYDRAAGLMKQLKQYAKIAKEKQDSIVKPIEQSVKEIKLLFKPFFNSVALIEEQVKSDMLAFVEHQQAQIKKLEEKLENGDIKKVATYHKKVSELTVNSENASLRSKQVLKIVNAKLIPREYLVPDETAIRAALLNGEEVKGCMLVKEHSLAI